MRSWPSWPCHSRRSVRDGRVEVVGTATVVQPEEVGLWTTRGDCISRARYRAVLAKFGDHAGGTGRATMRRAECHRLVVALIIVCAVAALFSAEHSTRMYRRSAEQQPSIRNDVALPIPALPRFATPLPILAPLPPPTMAVSSPRRPPAQQLAAAGVSRPAHCPPCPAADGLVAPIDGFQPSSAAELSAITAEHGAVGGVELWQQRPAQVGDACRCRISLPGSLDAPDLRESRVLAWLKRADGLVVAREASLPRGRRANDPERAVPQPKGAAASSARCRTFVVSGKRRDLNESVRKAAVRLGMCEYGSRQGNWFDFELRDPPDEEDTPKRFVRRKRGCISGYIPGLREALGTKTALARLRAECEGCAFLPPSFEFKWTEDAAGLHGPHAALRALSLAQASYPQLLTTYYSLLTAYCLLLLPAYCLLLTAYCLLLTACCVLRAALLRRPTTRSCGCSRLTMASRSTR